MSSFIELKSLKPEAIKSYKRELRAIVIDRAADHMRRTMARYKQPTARTYENALQDGLQRARLDVLAELFRIMHDLARESAVAQWSRADAGLKRRPRSRNAASDLIRAYLGAVKYVQNVKAQRRALSD
jgi:hypothetical protein